VNLEQRLSEAAFWQEWICLECAERTPFEDLDGGHRCPVCGGETTDAKKLQFFLAGIDAQRAAEG
jgi:rubrerythrin